MSVQPAFLTGPASDGLNALADTLSAHPRIHVARDAHVLTGLAHLGYYDKVYKAAYDHILAAEAQRLFVDRLPRKEADYVDACRAYAETLYARALETSGKPLLLDATAEYLNLAPFLRRIFPGAPVVVVTCHPLILLAQHGAPAAQRAIASAASMLRGQELSTLRVRAEDFAAEPVAQTDAVCAHLGQPFDAAASESAQAAANNIRLPENLAKDWSSPGQLEALRRFVHGLFLEDLLAYGYTTEEVWFPLDAAAGSPVPRVAPARGLSRRTLSRLRRAAQRPGPVNRMVRKVRLACDVLLRR